MTVILLFNHVLYPYLHYYLDGYTICTLLRTFKSVINFYKHNSHLLNIYIPYGHVLSNAPKTLKTKFPKCTIYASLSSLRTPCGTPIMSYIPPYVDRVFVDDPHAYRLHYGLVRASSMHGSMCSIPPIFDAHTIHLTRHYDIRGHEHEYHYVKQVANIASTIKATEHILPYIDDTDADANTDADVYTNANADNNTYTYADANTYIPITKDMLHIEFQYQTNQDELLKFKGCRSITYQYPITDVSAFSESKEVRIFTFTKQIMNLHTLSNVHTLILRSCRLDPTKGLHGLNNVRVLNISYTNIRSLAGLINIEELDISHCKQLTDTTALKTCTKLHTLIHIHTKVDTSELLRCTIRC